MSGQVVEFRMREEERRRYGVKYLVTAFLCLVAIFVPIVFGMWKELILVSAVGGVMGAIFAVTAFFGVWFWPPAYTLSYGEDGGLVLTKGQHQMPLANYSAMGLGDRKGREIVLVHKGHGLRFWNLRELGGQRRLWDHLQARSAEHEIFDCSIYKAEKEPLLAAISASPWRWLSSAAWLLFVFAMLLGGGLFFFLVEMSRGWEDPRFAGAGAMGIVLSFLWLSIVRIVKCSGHIYGDRLVVTGLWNARSYPIDAIVELRSQRSHTGVFFGDGRRLVFCEDWRCSVGRDLFETLRSYG